MSAPGDAPARPAAMKSVAEQSPGELGQGSVLTRQKDDHVKLDRLLRRLEDASAEEQQRVLLDIYRLVFPHAFAEETVLWPVMRKVLPDGEELTLKVEREHQEINDLIARLEGLDPGAAERAAVLDRVVQLLRQDVRDEEDQLLPRLQANLSRRQLRMLGRAWGMVRQIAPTRAHPVVSRRPPGNVAAALPLSLLDRARDLVDAALERGNGSAAWPLRPLSSALTGASHAVERLPMMRRGEDRSTRAEGKPGVLWGAIVLAGLAPLVFIAARRRR